MTSPHCVSGRWGGTTYFSFCELVGGNAVDVRDEGVDGGLGVERLHGGVGVQRAGFFVGFYLCRVSRLLQRIKIKGRESAPATYSHTCPPTPAP
jgi:hypothetical protein